MINFVASANTTSTPAATMVVTLPTHSEGDVIILSFVHNYNSASQVLTAVSEGYTELAGLAISGLGHQAAIWYKKAGASEANPTATYSASSQIMACIASSYSGVDGTVQIDVGPSLWTTEDPGDTTVIAPSVTTTLDGAMLVNVATADDNDAFTQPAGMTLVDNLEFNSMTTASAYELIATAGATGDKTWTFAQNTDEITAVSFALRPVVGGGGISIAVTESGPSFTESINTNLSVNITGAIVENGPAFTDAVSVTLTSLTLQANIAESGPSFTESIAATLTETLTISADIVEQGPSFTESITASLGVNITSVITELGPSFTESINISVIGDRVASIVENGPSFTESIIASIPITITVNPKNIIRVKRKDNTVIIKRKSNIIRVR